MESFKKTIGERIRKRRKDLGFRTQEAFAIALGVDQPRVNKWETGKNYPDEDHRRRICEILRIDQKELFEMAPPQSNPMIDLPPEAIKAIQEAVKQSIKASEPKPPIQAPERTGDLVADINAILATLHQKELELVFSFARATLDRKIRKQGNNGGTAVS